MGLQRSRIQIDSGEGTQQSSYHSHISEGMTASIEIDMFSTDRDCNLDNKTFRINLFKNHTYLISIADDLLLVTVKSLHHHGHDRTCDPWVFSVFVDWSITCVHDHLKNASDGRGKTCLFWYFCDPVQEGIVKTDMLSYFMLGSLDFWFSTWLESDYVYRFRSLHGHLAVLQL
jgi:hypothetical protein